MFMLSWHERCSPRLALRMAPGCCYLWPWQEKGSWQIPHNALLWSWRTLHWKESEHRAIRWGWGNGLRSHWSLHSLEDHSSILSSHPEIHFPHTTQSDLFKMQIQSLPFIHSKLASKELLKIRPGLCYGLHNFAWVFPHRYFMSYLTLHSWCSGHIVLISVPHHLVFSLSCIHSKSVWVPGMCQELSHVLGMHQWTKQKSFCPRETYVPVREDRQQTIKKRKV